MVSVNGIKNRIRKLKFNIKHDYLQTENILLIGAVVLCLVWTFQSIEAMTRNWELSERLTTERKMLERLEVEVELSGLENEYYRSEEYQELLARKQLDKKLEGENMVIMPPNSERAKNKYQESFVMTEEKEYSNLEKWVMYLFPSY